jgi:hypothetical protein
VPATRQPWILLICLFLLSLPAVTPRIYSSDEIQYFSYLRSLWFDHDLSFDNEYQYFYDRGVARSEGFHETFLERTTEAGRRVNFGTLGCALLWAPFYAAGDVAARVLRATGQPIETDGFSKPYIAAVAYGSAIYGAAALALAIASARALGLRAFGAAVAIWLGTPLLFYMYIAPPMSHACSAFAVALFVYTWLRVRERWSIRGALALGAVGALMGMVREQDMFFIAGPVLDFGLWALHADRTRPSLSRVAKAQRVAAAAAGFMLVYTPQAMAYVRLNGHLGPSRLVTRKMNWSAPHAIEVLFSPEHGLFIWTPLTLLAIAGLVWMLAHRRAGDAQPQLRAGRGADAPRYEDRTTSAQPQPHVHRGADAPGTEDPTGSAQLMLRVRRRVALCMLVMVIVQVYVGGSVESWTVAGGFGQRRFVALTALLVIGLAALYEAARNISVRRMLVSITLLAVYWNIALSVEFAVGLMDRQRLSPRQNAYDAFVTLPMQLPSLAYRYLFDRSSFYRSTPAVDRR